MFNKPITRERKKKILVSLKKTVTTSDSVACLSFILCNVKKAKSSPTQYGLEKYFSVNKLKNKPLP